MYQAIRHADQRAIAAGHEYGIAAQGNSLTGNGGSGAYIDTSHDENGSRFTFQENIISGNHDYGLYLASLSYGAYLGAFENTIDDNGDEGICVSKLTNGSDCIVTDNTMDGNGYGIYIGEASDGCLLDIEDNTVTGSLSSMPRSSRSWRRS